MFLAWGLKLEKWTLNLNEPKLRRAGFKPYFEREKPKFEPCVNGL